MTSEDFIINDKAIRDKDYVEIIAYNQEWPYQAKIEIDKLRAVLPKNSVVDIQHIGSTAVPGLSAKPILDIQIAAKSLDEMKAIAVPALQKIGYEYWANNPDIEDMFFVKGIPLTVKNEHIMCISLIQHLSTGRIKFYLEII